MPEYEDEATAARDAAGQSDSSGPADREGADRGWSDDGWPGDDVAPEAGSDRDVDAEASEPRAERGPPPPVRPLGSEERFADIPEWVSELRRMYVEPKTPAGTRERTSAPRGAEPSVEEAPAAERGRGGRLLRGWRGGRSEKPKSPPAAPTPADPAPDLRPAARIAEPLGGQRDADSQWASPLDADEPQAAAPGFLPPRTPEPAGVGEPTEQAEPPTADEVEDAAPTSTGDWVSPQDATEGIAAAAVADEDEDEGSAVDDVEAPAGPVEAAGSPDVEVDDEVLPAVEDEGAAVDEVDDSARGQDAGWVPAWGEGAFAVEDEAVVPADEVDDAVLPVFEDEGPAVDEVEGSAPAEDAGWGPAGGEADLADAAVDSDEDSAAHDVEGAVLDTDEDQVSAGDEVEDAVPPTDRDVAAVPSEDRSEDEQPADGAELVTASDPEPAEDPEPDVGWEPEAAPHVASDVERDTEPAELGTELDPEAGLEARQRDVGNDDPQTAVMPAVETTVEPVTPAPPRPAPSGDVPVDPPSVIRPGAEAPERRLADVPVGEAAPRVAANPYGIPGATAANPYGATGAAAPITPAAVRPAPPARGAAAAGTDDPESRPRQAEYMDAIIPPLDQATWGEDGSAVAPRRRPRPRPFDESDAASSDLTLSPPEDDAQPRSRAETRQASRRHEEAGRRIRRRLLTFVVAVVVIVVLVAGAAYLMKSNGVPLGAPAGLDTWVAAMPGSPGDPTSA